MVLDYNDPQYWTEEEQALFDELGPLALDIFFTGGESGAAELPPDVRILLDYDVYNETAVAWLNEWKSTVFHEFNETTQNSVTKTINEWVVSGEALPVLEKRLEPIFGRKRAEMIATTEVTRMYAEGNLGAWDATGVVGGSVWRTANDELVCPVCGPLHNQEADLYSNGFTTEEGGIGLKSPPAHPRCRCWLQPVVSEDMFREELRRILDEGPITPTFATVSEAETWARRKGVLVDYYGLSVQQANITNDVINDLILQGESVPRAIRTGLEDAGFMNSGNARGFAQWVDWSNKENRYKEVRRVWLDTNKVHESISNPSNTLLSQSYRGLIQHESAHIGHVDRWVETFGFSEDTYSRVQKHLYSNIELPKGMTLEEITKQVSPQSVINNAEFVAEVKTGLWNGVKYSDTIMGIFDNAVGVQYGVSPWR